MDAHREATLARQVSEMARTLGYETTMEPSRTFREKLRRVGRGTSQRMPNCRPDLILEKSGKSVIVEIKAGPVLLGGVIQTKKCAESFDAPAILCVPDESFRRIPGSVRDFARQSRVGLCPISRFGSALEDAIRLMR